jgi:hypothetical protein
MRPVPVRVVNQTVGERKNPRVVFELRHARKGGGYGEPRLDRTTQLYDRRRDEMSLDEVERIVI